MLKIFLLLFVVGIVLNSQPLQIPQIKFSPKKYICYKAESPILIDGKLDESSWAKAEWTDDFVDIEGPVKPAPRFRTRAKMLWDENCLYILAELTEPNVWSYYLMNHLYSQ